MNNENFLGERSPLRIAICGIRGIPACYGGFETFAEELSTRLVERGHGVVVYGRSHVIQHREPSYRGVEIRLLPAPQHKYFETPLHTLRCLIDIVRRRQLDVLLVCNAANSPLLWLPRLCRIPVAVNLDGIERQRAKWNAAGKAWYRLGEICSVLFATRMISDADVIREYYKATYGRDSEMIRYGCRLLPAEERAARIAGTLTAPGAGELFRELAVEPDRYLLYVSRLEPENNAHLVIEAYEKLGPERTNMPLVVVGDAPYARDYIAGLKSAAGPNVRFAGYRFGPAYEQLQKSAHLYIQATEVGGTHPALVESMGFGNCIVANDTPEHREVLGNAGRFYRKNDAESLTEELTLLLRDPGRVQSLRTAALERSRAEFDWEKITNSYEELFYRLSGVANRSDGAAAAHDTPAAVS